MTLSTRPRTLLAALCAALLFGAAQLPSAQPEKKATKTKADDLFGLGRVHSFHLELTVAEWAKMQDVRGGMGFGPGKFGKKDDKGPPKFDKIPEKPAEKTEAKADAEKRDVHKNLGFGMEFPWAKASFTAEGETIKGVGVRYKGNASYMASARGLKRNLKVEIDHYDDALRFRGLKTISLNAGGMDPLRLREALGYAVFRAAGVPAPRTAFAEVTLTVPGKYDKELLGLYTFVEHVDKTFLKDRLGSSKGLLMKPERVRGIEYLGEDWAAYKQRFQPKREPSKREARRVIDFAKLVNSGDQAQFDKQIDAYLDVDEFLRFLAVNAFIVNMDSFLTMGHNYYLYLRPDGKFIFIPWDLDLSFGGFPMMGGTPDQQLDLSMTHPHPGPNQLVDRLLAAPKVKERYQTILKELTATCFTKDKLLAMLDTAEKATREPLAREKTAVAARKEGAGGFGPPGFGPPGGPPGGFGGTDMRTFIDKRVVSVIAQAEGKSKGTVPTMGFGKGFGPGKGGPGFGPGMFFAKAVLQAADTDKDGKLSQDELTAAVKAFFKECDKEKKGKLNAPALAEGINRLFPAPGGFGPPKGFPPMKDGPPKEGPPKEGPPKGPFFFGGGPGGMLAGVILKRAGVEMDGEVTEKQLLAAATGLFKESDKENRGKLDEAAVAAAINRLFPPPPGFGPPGGPPMGPPGFPPGGPMGPPKKE